MGPREQRLRQILTETFSPLHLEVENESYKHSVPKGSETHFKVLLVSDVFTGQSRVERQRGVHAAVKTEFDSGLHALTQKTLSPQEWDSQKSSVEFVSPDCLGGSKHDKR